MIGIVVALIAALPGSASAPAIWAADPACDQGPSACDIAAVMADADGDAAPSTDEPRYATQAIIDCPSPLVADARPGAAGGECDGTPFDASYRASRDPESERTPGSLRPARRERSNAGVRAACTGSPGEGRDGTVNPTPAQPMALFALPSFLVFPSSRISVDTPAAFPSRGRRPLERPPRA